jgi:hypothetical protein
VHAIGRHKVAHPFVNLRQAIQIELPSSHFRLIGHDDNSICSSRSLSGTPGMSSISAASNK